MADVRNQVEEIYREDSARIRSTLIRLVGDFELADDAIQEAFAAALAKWPTEGVPNNPRAWLISAAKFRAIDAIRRNVRQSTSLNELANRLEQEPETNSIEDDRLRLIFTCCHPALSPEAQVSLTLREVCGLTTEEIAHAFLTAPTALAQRIVRAKAKIRVDKIPYEVPEPDQMPERLQQVLRVTYLLYNEGYYASFGDQLTRQILSEEAIRLGGMIAELLPDPEVHGLLALMLLTESRRAARSTEEGDVILLADQDRKLWNQSLIAEGQNFAAKALSTKSPGPYALQAGMAVEHVKDQTDWPQIVNYYDQLLEINNTSIVALNRAVAVAMSEGPQVGLEVIDKLLAEGNLQNYGLAHSARADLCRRLKRNKDAIESYNRALELSTQEPERRFLKRKLNELREN